MVPHPDYNNALDGSDIVLMKLDFPVVGVSFAQLKQTKPRVMAGDPLIAVGFGKKQHNDTGSDGLLRKADNLTAVSWQVRTGEYYGTNAVRHDLQFCAGTTQQRTCGGDSGGPVLDQNGLQVGITSFGVTNCDLHHPRVFTRGSYFADWIQETVCAIGARPPPYCDPTSTTSTSATTKSPTLRPAARPTKRPVSAPTREPTSQPTHMSDCPHCNSFCSDCYAQRRKRETEDATRTVEPAVEQASNTTTPSSRACSRATAIVNVAVLLAIATISC